MTQHPTPIGFWSYTSSDDTASKGRLSQLRRLLADQLHLRIGRTPKVHIFQDVAAIPHGTDWLKEIHRALDQSWFFIPIVTPAFLQSEMCCKEVMRFREREAALGRDDLIFPFHYVSVDDIEAQRPGDVHDPEVLDLLRSRQWIDFRELRLRDPESEAVLIVLDAFAASLRGALRRDIRAQEQKAHSAARGITAAPIQSHEAERRLGPSVARAREAALRQGPLTERAFPIELSGVSGWPKPDMIAIPPGKFVMGAPKGEKHSNDNERPQHEVSIDYVFALGKCTVTLAEFSAFVAETKHETGTSAFIFDGKDWKDMPGKGWRDPGFTQTDKHPVTCVSWDDSQIFLKWLNGRLGLTDRPDAYRLPSEAEWEYACRAGKATPFSFGETISTAQANYDGNYTYGAGKKGEYRKRTTPVGSFPANVFGLHDMHGNVWEWVEDCYQDSYAGTPVDGSANTTGSCSYRVVRGGSWGDLPQLLRSAQRTGDAPAFRFIYLGFRLARTLFTP